MYFEEKNTVFLRVGYSIRYKFIIPTKGTFCFDLST
jgi:hypothetical protein